jgi:hypothetical protein
VAHQGVGQGGQQLLEVEQAGDLRLAEHQHLGHRRAPFLGHPLAAANLPARTRPDRYGALPATLYKAYIQGYRYTGNGGGDGHPSGARPRSRVPVRQRRVHPGRDGRARAAAGGRRPRLLPHPACLDDPAGRRQRHHPQFIRLAERISGEQLDDLFQTWLFTGSKPALEAAAAARVSAASSAPSMELLRR